MVLEQTQRKRYNEYMTKNPIINALGASGYILLIVSVMTFISDSQKNKPDTFFTPIVFLSLLTLSAATMAYIFFYQPLQLLIEGKKKQALDLFVRTVGIFGAITAVGLILLSVGVI